MPPVPIAHSIKEHFPPDDELREIGAQAVWSLSSCKPESGVQCLRDNNMETYWQSDGSQPHLVNINFRSTLLMSLFF